MFSRIRRLFCVRYFHDHDIAANADRRDGLTHIDVNDHINSKVMYRSSTRNNSFDFMRFAAAVAVLVSHHSALSGAIAPVMPIFRDNLGGVAVCVFFAMSGFLIYQSLERSASWTDFFAARLARLIPNLAVALIMTSAVMLIWFENYDHLAAHVGYVINNMMMFFWSVQFIIPGVLEGRPNPSPNGSLWTLRYEFWLYAALFAIFLLKPQFRVVAICLAFIFMGILWMRALPGDHIWLMGMNFDSYFLGKLGSYFLAGALLASLWHMLTDRWLIVASGALVVAVLSTFILPTENPILALAFSIFIISLCSLNWAAPFGKFGDASYGIYIFAFPVQQLTLLIIEEFYTSMVAALMITIMLGYTTWHLFEERCLRKRDVLARWLGAPFFYRD